MPIREAVVSLFYCVFYASAMQPWQPTSIKQITDRAQLMITPHEDTRDKQLFRMTY